MPINWILGHKPQHNSPDLCIVLGIVAALGYFSYFGNFLNYALDSIRLNKILKK